MASAFWTLEDGRTLARRWSGMSYMLAPITDELKLVPEANAFYLYLEQFGYKEENGDDYNGHGGFIRKDQNRMLNFDLRTIAPVNRDYFWDAAQKALFQFKMQNHTQNEGIEMLLTTLLDMHKSIENGEDPMMLNDLTTTESDPKIKLGPGW